MRRAPLVAALFLAILAIAPYGASQTGTNASLTLLTTPTNDIASTLVALAYSPDGLYLAFGEVDAPSTESSAGLFAVSGETHTQLVAPDGLGDSVDQARSVGWRPDSQHVAFGDATSPFLHVFGKTDATNFDDDIALNVNPNGQVSAIAYHPTANEVALGISTGGPTFLQIYTFTDSLYTRETFAVDTQPAGPVRGIAYNADGSTLYVAHTNAPYAVAYDRTAGPTYTQRSINNPPSLHGETASATSVDDFLAIGSQEVGGDLHLYSIGTGSEILRQTLSFDGIPRATNWSHSGSHIVYGASVAPHLRLFYRDGFSLQDTAGIASPPASTVRSTAFHRDDGLVAVGESSTPYLNIYRATGIDFDPTPCTGFVGPTGCLYDGDRAGLASTANITPTALDIGLGLIFTIGIATALGTVYGRGAAVVGAAGGALVSIGLGFFPIWVVLLTLATVVAAYLTVQRITTRGET